MIISFSPQFVPKILDGTKIHTLREDKANRWQAGRKMHMYTGRYTAKDRQFIKEDTCKSTQYVNVQPDCNWIEIGYMSDEWGFMIDRVLIGKELREFARNDGFDSLESFWQWFTATQTLKLIHWTDKRY